MPESHSPQSRTPHGQPEPLLRGPLYSFLVVARLGHVTRAARELHLTQPAVSAQLARLEEQVGTALFHRTPKGMELTEAGRVFHHHVEQAHSWLDDGISAVAALQGLHRGAMSVGGGATATTYLLPPVLSAFHDHHPANRLHIREQGSRAVVEGVLGGDLDLGVVTLPIDPEVSRGPQARITVLPWVDDELLMVVPAGHALYGQATFRWGALHGMPLVMFEAGTAVRRLIDRALSEAEVAPQIVMELRSIESIKQMVAQGIGAAFVSRFALPDPDAGLRPAGRQRPLSRKLAVIHRSDRPLGPAAAAFVAHMGLSPELPRPR